MNMVSEPFLFEYQRTSASLFREIFHAHLEMEFTFVHEGVGNLIIDGRTFPIEPGTLLMFHPFQLHRVQIQVTPERPFIRSLIIFNPIVLQPYWGSFPALKGFFHMLKQHQKFGKPVYYNINETDPMILLMKQFHELRSKLSPHEIQEELHFLLLTFLKQFQRIWQEPLDHPPTVSKYHHRAEEIMEWIEQNYHEPFRLELMAHTLHLSRYHLVHLFKEATGTTILAYVQATRIRHACELLMKTSLTIPEIGVRAGIPNPSYFCRVFRETIGTTPHQYRLNIQKN